MHKSATVDDILDEESEAGQQSKPKKKISKKRKIISIVSICLVIALGVVGVRIGIMFIPKGGSVVSTNYGSVSYEVGDGEYYSEGSYTGLEIFGRLNWTFAHKTKWYSKMESTVHTAVEQKVSTYKQFRDGVLISADITTSSLINSAKEFCYVPSEDRVIWREAACGPSGYNGFKTQWKKGEPKGNMNISGPDGFKAVNGMPATELSGLVIRDETVLSTENVVDNGDGTYTVVFNLDPKLYEQEDGSYRGSVAYYVNQMVFSGNLTDIPKFNSITISYTFNDKWEVIKSRSKEDYSATMGFTAACVSEAETYYYYDDAPFEETDDFNNYFAEYVTKPTIDNDDDVKIDSMGALTSAFQPIITEPTTLYFNLDVNNKPVNGIIFVDLHNGGSLEDISADKMEIRVKLGNVSIWLDGGAVYISSGEWKICLAVSEFFDLFSDITGSNSESAGGQDGSGILQDIMNGAFSINGRHANMRSELNIADIKVPVDFNYNIGENNDVSLDNVKTSFTAGDIAVSAEIGYSDLTPPLAIANKEEFILFSSYLNNVFDLLTSDVLHADLNYNDEEHGFSVNGGIDVKLNESVAAKADITINYGDVCKNVLVSFDGETAYVEIDGIKIKANVNETIEFLKGLINGPSSDKNSVENNFDLAEIINVALFTTTLTDNISIDEKSIEEVNTLEIAVKGTELLKAFGFDFELGNVQLKIFGEKDCKIGANALGAEVVISAGKDFTLDTDGIEIIKYANDLIKLVKSGNLKIDVSYKGNDITADGEINLDLETLNAAGSIVINYKEIKKNINVIYALDIIYVEIDGVKIKANLTDAIKIVKSIIATKDNEIAIDAGDDEINDILTKILGLKFDDYLKLSESENELTLSVKGTELLKEFGIDFSLGNVDLKVTEGKVEAHAQEIGADITVTAGKKFEVNTDGFLSIDGVLSKVPDILSAKTLSLKGRIDLGVKDKNVILDIKKGFISWEEGINAYLDVTIGEYGDIIVNITEDQIGIVYGDVGVQLSFSEFDSLEQALFNAYGELRNIITKVIKDETKNPLPALKGIEDLIELLGDASTAGDILNGLLSGESDISTALKNFDWASIVSDVVLSSDVNGEFLRLAYKDLILKVTDRSKDGEFLALNLEYKNGKTDIVADLSVNIYSDAIPDMPSIDYLGVEELDELLEYVTAAVNTLVQNDIMVKLNGTIKSSEEKYAVSDWVKYDLDATINYHSPNGLPVFVNLDGKSVRIDNSIYLKLILNLQATASDEQSAFIEISVFDLPVEIGEDEAPKGDGVLDFFVSVSKYGNEDRAKAAESTYKPLTFHASADEIMTILSDVMLMLGVDEGIINDYLITKWITDPDIAERFGSLGVDLVPIISGFINFDLSSIGDKLTGKDKSNEAKFNSLKESGYSARKELIKQLTYDNGQATIILNLGTIFGDKYGDIEILLGKEIDGDIPRLTAVSLVNFKTDNDVVDLNIDLKFDAINPETPTAEYDFTGIDELLIVLANSAVHKESENVDPEEIISGERQTVKYAVNNNFYIEGNINANLFGIVSVDIQLVAISVTVDEDGKVGINIRLSYEGYKLGLTAINGDSVVDITIKENMVFIKRVQTSEFGPLAIYDHEIDPVTLYRAMPLDNFMDDILGQLSFILNFGDLISNEIDKAETNPNTGEGTASNENKDYGTILTEVLKSFSFGHSEDGSDQWTISIDGRSFSNGILGNLTVNLNADNNKLLRTLNVTECQILIPINESNNLTLNLSCNLTWYNPGGVMSDGKVDQTDSELADLVLNKLSGMGAKIEALNNIGWAEKQFLEGEIKTVKFYNKTSDADEYLGEQKIMVSTGGDNNQKGMIYSEINYPSTLETDKYYSVWDDNGVFSSDGAIYARQKIKTYNVTFISKEEIDGWTYDANNGYWVNVVSMQYDAQIKFFALNKEFADRIIVKGDMSVTLPDRPLYDGDSSDESVWSISFSETGAEFTVNYASVVSYHSDVEFTLDDNTYTSYSKKLDGDVMSVIEPTAEGYVFLGWYLKTSEGWKQVTTINKTDSDILNGTLEALWISVNSFEVTTKTNPIKTKYTVTTNFDNGGLKGAFAKESQCSVEYKYTFHKRNSQETVDFTTNNTEEKGGTAFSPYTSVDVTFKFTVTVGDNQFIFEYNKSAQF